jgi:hypothetical protein
MSSFHEVQTVSIQRLHNKSIPRKRKNAIGVTTHLGDHEILNFCAKYMYTPNNNNAVCPFLNAKLINTSHII